MINNRFLYIMHVPWSWIKQRPHFIAEGIAKRFPVDVFAICGFRTNNGNTDKPNLTISKLHLNFERKNWGLFTFLKGLAYDTIVKIQIPSFKKYTHIWVTNIYTYKFVRNLIKSNQTLIYDCMDDDFEFPSIKCNKDFIKELHELELELVNRADYIFCSSEYLKEKVSSRTKSSKTITLVNNGIKLPIYDNTKEIPAEIVAYREKIKSSPFPFLYIGTISEWFDFEMIINALARLPWLNIFLIGPTEVEIPIHPRLIHIPPIDRNYIFDLMADSKALIMPFKLNELIKSVNPVKLYEYIYSKKPIIATKYTETEKFVPFVNLYSNIEEFVDFCTSVYNNEIGLPAQKDIESFIDSNTWKNRVNQIIDTIIK